MSRAALAAAVLAMALLCGGGALAEGGKSFVWRIDDADSSVYLVGSIHLLPPRAYPLPAPFQTAFEDAEIVAFETDIAALREAETQAALLQAAQYDQGTLASHLGERLYAQTRLALARAGVPMAQVARFKPWFVAGLIELRLFIADGFRRELGLDGHFYERAVAADKAILPLEPLAEHLRVLIGMPPEMSRAFLAATVTNLDELENAPSEVYTLWRAGDAAGLAALTREQVAANPALYERLLFARNAAWLDDIEALLAGPDDAMVVVGALHLPGERGLLALLRQRGQRVVQQ